MYLYVITYQSGGMPEDLTYFQRLHFMNQHDCSPVAYFGRTGKPKVFRTDKAARKAVERIMTHGGNTNLGYYIANGDGNLKIKEIDLHSNYIMDQYY